MWEMQKMSKVLTLCCNTSVWDFVGLQAIRGCWPGYLKVTSTKKSKRSLSLSNPCEETSQDLYAETNFQTVHHSLCSSPSPITCLKLQSSCTYEKGVWNMENAPTQILTTYWNANWNDKVGVHAIRDYWPGYSKQHLQRNSGEANSLNLTHVKKLLKNYMLKQKSKVCIPISASPPPLSHA
jgi:hypothetical protein